MRERLRAFWTIDPPDDTVPGDRSYWRAEVAARRAFVCAGFALVAALVWAVIVVREALR